MLGMETANVYRDGSLDSIAKKKKKKLLTKICTYLTQRILVSGFWPKNTDEE